MLPVSLTSAEFYRRRDNRTNMCPGASGYESVRILVTADSDVVHTSSGQLAVVGLVNQLARWCRAIVVEIPSAPVLLPVVASPDLSIALLKVMAGADPFGAFSVTRAATGPADIHIHIGAGRTASRAEKFIHASYSGWFGIVTDGTAETPAIPLGAGQDYPGAAVASCLACARAFQLAVGELQLTQRSLAIDLWTLSPLRPRVDRPWDKVDRRASTNILLVGAGSVGSSAAYWIRFFEITGTMHVVDHDTAQIENLSRGLPFTIDNLDQNKARIVADLFAGSQLQVAPPFETDWNGYVAKTGRKGMPTDLWLPLANERNVRASMQENFPPVMIHASTGRNWGANFGRHIPFRDDCIIDRFPIVNHEPVLRCSTAPIKNAGKEVDAALPFLSAFAGLLVAADVARSMMSDFPQTPNFGSFDFQSGLVVQAWDRRAADSCLCRRLSRAMWDLFNPNCRLPTSDTQRPAA